MPIKKLVWWRDGSVQAHGMVPYPSVLWDVLSRLQSLLIGIVMLVDYDFCSNSCNVYSFHSLWSFSNIQFALHGMDIISTPGQTLQLIMSIDSATLPNMIGRETEGFQGIYDFSASSIQSMILFLTRIYTLCARFLCCNGIPFAWRTFIPFREIFDYAWTICRFIQLLN